MLFLKEHLVVNEWFWRVELTCVVDHEVLEASTVIGNEESFDDQSAWNGVCVEPCIIRFIGINNMSVVFDPFLLLFRSK